MKHPAWNDILTYCSHFLCWCYRDIRDRSVLRLFEPNINGNGAVPSWDQDQSYFSEPEFDSDYQHQHIHKTKVNLHPLHCSPVHFIQACFYFHSMTKVSWDIGVISLWTCVAVSEIFVLVFCFRGAKDLRTWLTVIQSVLLYLVLLVHFHQPLCQLSRKVRLPNYIQTCPKIPSVHIM